MKPTSHPGGEDISANITQRIQDLGDWRGEDEAVILRVFMTGLKIDGLAARLLRRDPSLTLLSVEPEDGRLGVELSGRRDD